MSVATNGLIVACMIDDEESPMTSSTTSPIQEQNEHIGLAVVGDGGHTVKHCILVEVDLLYSCMTFCH